MAELRRAELRHADGTICTHPTACAPYYRINCPGTYWRIKRPHTTMLVFRTSLNYIRQMYSTPAQITASTITSSQITAGTV